MAEIVRIERTVRRQFVSRRSGAEEIRTSTEVTTTVRSIHGSDASVLRDFVAALEAADAPDRARIDCRRTDGLVTGFVAEWKTTGEPTEEMESGTAEPTQ